MLRHFSHVAPLKHKPSLGNSFPATTTRRLTTPNHPCQGKSRVRLIDSGREIWRWRQDFHDLMGKLPSSRPTTAWESERPPRCDRDEARLHYARPSMQSSHLPARRGLTSIALLRPHGPWTGDVQRACFAAHACRSAVIDDGHFDAGQLLDAAIPSLRATVRMT